MNFSHPSALAILIFAFSLAPSQRPVPSGTPSRVPPTRDPHAAGFVTGTELADGTVPPADEDGNFILGQPIHRRAKRSLGLTYRMELYPNSS